MALDVKQIVFAKTCTLDATAEGIGMELSAGLSDDVAAILVAWATDVAEWDGTPGSPPHSTRTWRTQCEIITAEMTVEERVGVLKCLETLVEQLRQRESQDG